jgi:hypothetical protein
LTLAPRIAAIPDRQSKLAQPLVKAVAAAAEGPVVPPRVRALALPLTAAGAVPALRGMQLVAAGSAAGSAVAEARRTKLVRAAQLGLLALAALLHLPDRR